MIKYSDPNLYNEIIKFYDYFYGSISRSVKHHPKEQKPQKIGIFLTNEQSGCMFESEE